MHLYLGAWVLVAYALVIVRQLFTSFSLYNFYFLFFDLKFILSKYSCYCFFCFHLYGISFIIPSLSVCVCLWRWTEFLVGSIKLGLLIRSPTVSYFNSFMFRIITGKNRLLPFLLALWLFCYSFYFCYFSLPCFSSFWSLFLPFFSFLLAFLPVFICSEVIFLW